MNFVSFTAFLFGIVFIIKWKRLIGFPLGVINRQEKMLLVFSFLSAAGYTSHYNNGTNWFDRGTS